MIGAVAVVAIGATGAFFSDTETSTGNTFTAGAIDLGIDNTSYYNGHPNPGTSWTIDYDLDDGCPNPLFDPANPVLPSTIPCLFFNFSDLKPGDTGEDTISLHVNNNNAWACVDVTLTKNDDVDCTEPENDINAENGACDDPDLDATDGELANAVEFLWWADDGDNVLEDNEHVINSGAVLGALAVNQTASVPLATPDGNGVLGSGPLTGAQDYYIGKAWCFGGINPVPDDQDGSGILKTPAGDNAGLGQLPDGTPGTPEDGGFSCSGASGAGNETQTDSLMADITFRAEQERNNPDFTCALPNGSTF